MVNITVFNATVANITSTILSATAGPAPAPAKDEEEPPEPWEAVFTVITVVIMFTVLMTDRIATDCVMLTALTTFYIAGIITIKEALSGFSSQGLLTVLALFAVAEGLNKTGALHYYVGRLLGSPKTISEAQLRVMVPISMLSGFINDTPLVTVALPSVIQWARKIQVPTRYLLLPLSYSALLGGVCTLIGTSTNLVIAGLLQDRYEDDPEFQNMSLFALGKYGVPVTMAGIAYVIIATPWLLKRGKYRDTATAGLDDMFSDALLGARLTAYSPAAGRTVQRSGLRDTGGIYLVRVQRASTGNVHHAVGPDFVLEVGDVLFFTGLVETFGDFCAEHALEMVTNEVDNVPSLGDGGETSSLLRHTNLAQDIDVDQLIDQADTSDTFLDDLGHIVEVDIDGEVGFTLDSLLGARSNECMRVVHHMQDAVRGEPNAYRLSLNPPRDRVVVATVQPGLVVVAIETKDRSGLLLDISKCLSRLDLDLHHTEAAVLEGRSLSIWRCQPQKIPPNFTQADLDAYIGEVWSIINALLAKESGVEALKKRGLRVLRALVVPGGRLVGKTAAEINFRQTYKAAIVAIQNNKPRNETQPSVSLANVKLDVGDALVLQVSDDSPLLLTPPKDFYKKLAATRSGDDTKPKSFFGFGTGNRSADNSVTSDNQNLETIERGQGEDEDARREREAVWADLQVIVSNSSSGVVNTGEILAAMKVLAGSRLEGQTVAEAGIDSMPDVILVSMERPINIGPGEGNVTSFAAIATTQPLCGGDVLWFSCKNASVVGDLRKIPGLESFEASEVEKINSKVYDRQLVQAVVSRKGDLVGKTVKELRFRTRYGAAVIAIQREGQRVHDHPGNIKLQAGDVLLLEAGPSFLTEKIHRDSSFTLVSAVKDSAPPRMWLLIPALIITFGAYGTYMLKIKELFGCAMVANILMVALGVMSQSEARDAIRWDIFLTIASAYGIGTALVNSGVAKTVADALVSVGNATGLGDAGLLGAVYLSTVIISQLVANNAAAALIFPIAMDAAESTGIDLTLMSHTIMLAASAAFMTPFGYQTNLMVMGPGGYSNIDYLIFGTPMQVILWLLTTAYLVTPVWITWLSTFVVFVVCAVFQVSKDRQELRSMKAGKRN